MPVDDCWRSWRRRAVALLCCGASLFATTNCHTRKLVRIDVGEAPRPGMMRTVFLHSRGWYELHLDGHGEPDTTALNEIYSKPDAAARFAAREFANWHPSQGGGLHVY